MLDHHLLLHDFAATQARLSARGVSPDEVLGLQQLVDARRKCIGEVEAKRQALNQATAEIQREAQSGAAAAVAARREGLRALKGEIKALETELETQESALTAVLLTLPNLPHATVPAGRSEADNVVVRSVGALPQYDFAPRPHWDVLEALNLVSFQQAAKLSGARFAVLRGAGARLERGLAQLMLSMAAEHGYTEVSTPLLVRPEAMQAAGQYPKFVGEAFETLDREYALIPTSEVPLVNLHAGEILPAEALPVRYTAYTPCFRREAGAAGRDTRGLIRLHQFNKVELVTLSAPEDSDAELERLTGHATAVLDRLELPYRVVSLCTGDMGFAAAKTYDLEVWLPGQGAYREISSCSNCGDFQARRAQIRCRPADGRGKPRLLHTLNGSGLAVGRTLVALVENYQQADGSLRIPPALVPFVGFDHVPAPPAGAG